MFYFFFFKQKTAYEIVAFAYEGRLEDGARLKDYREARGARLRRRIQGDTPWYKDLETVRLAQRIREAETLLGPAHPFVARLTPGASAEGAAPQLIGATRPRQ